MSSETFQDLVLELWPGSSEGAVETLIWSTPFPFVPGEQVVSQLRDLRTRHDKIGGAIGELMDEFDAEIQQVRKKANEST